jgi:DNA-binding IclR family transcriptional regulator
MAHDDRFTTLTPAVEQAAEILRYLASESNIKAGLTHISETVRINKSKTHVILSALQKSGFVLKDQENKLYSLGFGLIPIGLMALENTDYGAAAKPVLAELAHKTHCSALFGLIAGENLVVTEVEQSGQILESRMKPGHTFPLFYGAHGKVIVSSLPDAEREQILATKKVAFEGENSEQRCDDLNEELDACRRNGFAHRSIGHGDIVNLLASVVLGPNGRPIGALLIVGLFKKSDVKKYGARLAESSRKLSKLLGANLSESYNQPKKIRTGDGKRIGKS